MVCSSLSIFTNFNVEIAGKVSAFKMSKSWENQLSSKIVSPLCLKRIQKDIMDISKNPTPGIFVLPDEDNMRKMSVLIIGPPDTRYHGGMFSFLIGFTDEYPMKPPLVICLTAAGRSHRLHPHIFTDGRLCLSTLNSQFGEGWSPVMTLSVLTLTLQSFLSDEPYHHVNGYDSKDKESVKKYNTIIQHETIRVAVIEVMEKIDTYHEYFVEKIKAIFNEHYDHYTNFCKENMHLDGQSVAGPFQNTYKYEFKMLLDKIESIKKNI